MKFKTEYRVVQGFSLKEIKDKVEEALLEPPVSRGEWQVKAGWKLVGGVAVVQFDEKRISYQQAMTREGIILEENDKGYEPPPVKDER
jgi:hypothetical protein